MFELDGSYFAEDVTREFGENRVVAGSLTVVYPLNNYVREHGRNLTKRATDGAHALKNWLVRLFTPRQ
jgi:hypothetical protein